MDNVLSVALYQWHKSSLMALSPGLQLPEGVHSGTGTTARNQGRLLEDDLGTTCAHDRHADQVL